MSYTSKFTGEEIDAGIEYANQIHGDLYNEVIEKSYTLDMQTANPSTSSFNSVYNYSTFSGWGVYAGNPSKFDRVAFPIKAREDYPIGDITVDVYKMPDYSTITPPTGTGSYTPNPTEWEKVASASKSFSESLEDTSNYTIVNVDFNTVYENTDNAHLFLHFYSTARLTAGLLKLSFSDAPYNPGKWYSSNGNSNLNRVTETLDMTDVSSIYVVPCAFYYSETINHGKQIDTSSAGAFAQLVLEAVNNSDTFSTVFEEKIQANYAGSGSQNTVSNLTVSNSLSNSGRVMTGRCFPIGKISSETIWDGVNLLIKPRGLNDVTTNCTKVYAYLYEVDVVPENADTVSWSGMNPVLVRSGVADVDLPIDSVYSVTIPWSEGQWQNTNNKFLMLGYNLDTYASHLFCSGYAADFCSAQDGETYTKLDSWYSTSKGSSPSWAPRYTDGREDLWCAVTLSKVFDFGQGFYDKLDELVGETAVNTAPTSEVRLAKQYDVVVGDTFQLFYEGVIKSFDALKEGIRCSCSRGNSYNRYWEYTPSASDAGKTFTLTLTTRRLDGSVISTGTTNIVVHNKLTDETTPSNLNVLLFGDSLTGAGAWCAEGLRRIYGTNPNPDNCRGPESDGVTNTLTTYGGYKNTTNTFTVNHEGHSGWTWASFIGVPGDTSTNSQLVITLTENHGYDLDTVSKSSWTDDNGLLWELEEMPSDISIIFNRGTGNTGQQSTITEPTSMTCSDLGLTISNISTVTWNSTNPFYDWETERLNFAAHAAKYDNAGADIVACLLTWNGGGSNATFDHASAIETHMNNATTLLTQIHSDLPNAKIICMGIQISDLNGGCGKAYNSSGAYFDTHATAFYAFDYNKALEELCCSDDFKDYCIYIDTKGQFDTRNMMPYNMKYVNTREQYRTVTSGYFEHEYRYEPIGANGVHAWGDGYLMMCDAFYRALTRVIPSFVETT